MSEPNAQTSDTTDDHLLGGRVSYAQPARGFRSGIEPVLLAASVPARPGQRVLEGGSGAGAALLCLAARVPGLSGTGIDRDSALAGLARRNAAANGQAGLEFIAADLTGPRGLAGFDHALANPPYHLAEGTLPTDASRLGSKHGAASLLADWAMALGNGLRPRGTLTFIIAAAGVPACLAAFTSAGCAPAALLPLWPKRDQAAKLVLLRGIKRGRGALRVLPGLVLHEQDGRFTAAAEAVLRDGGALRF